MPNDDIESNISYTRPLPTHLKTVAAIITANESRTIRDRIIRNANDSQFDNDGAGRFDSDMIINTTPDSSDPSESRLKPAAVERNRTGTGFIKNKSYVPSLTAFNVFDTIPKKSMPANPRERVNIPCISNTSYMFHPGKDAPALYIKKVINGMIVSASTAISMVNRKSILYAMREAILFRNEII